MIKDITKNKFHPDYAIPPGATLKELLKEREIKQKEFAKRVGLSPKTISEIVTGKAPITYETALLFERVLDIPAHFWIRREMFYRETLARLEKKEDLKKWEKWAKHFPVAAMKKLNLISSDAEINIVEEILRFFSIAEPQQWEIIWNKWQPQFRKSQTFKTDKYALSVWLRWGELKAKEINCSPFSKSKLKKILPQIRSLSRDTDPNIFIPKLQKLAASAGIAIIFIPELPKIRVSGATWWVSSKKAVIQLSLRYKTNDHLWFTFFHEIGHILLHGKKFARVEFAGEKAGDKIEKEANKFASELLIPYNEYENFIKSKKFDEKSIIQFAEYIGIAPGIVVGRLQYDKKIRWDSYLNNLKIKYKWTQNKIE